MMRINELKVGMSATISKQASTECNEVIAQISGDYNPIHFDEKKAKEVGFEGIIAHALFAEGLISCVLGMQLPGEGAIIMSKEIKCLSPVYMFDIVSAYAEVKSIDINKKRVHMYVKCTNQDNRLLIEGDVLMCIR